jgi:hypothetical protein
LAESGHSRLSLPACDLRLLLGGEVVVEVVSGLCRPCEGNLDTRKNQNCG